MTKKRKAITKSTTKAEMKSKEVKRKNKYDKENGKLKQKRVVKKTEKAEQNEIK